MNWFKPIKNFFQDYIFNSLPSYYQNNDTYIDSEGKGILERFIGVCSEYLDKEVMPDIDNFMDCLDVDISNPIFLNYLWEYFGFFPYAYGVITYGKPYTEENLKQWLKEDRGYPLVDSRKLLKYAISLYKIRGTKLFYEVLGKFYGVTFNLSEVEEKVTKFSKNPLDGGSVIYDSASYFDTDNTKFDTKTDCWECVPMVLTIGISEGQWIFFSEKDKEIQEELLEEWKGKNPGATEDEINDMKEQISVEHPSDYTDKVKSALVNIVNKYLPVNVKIFDPKDSSTVIFNKTAAVLIL